MKPGKPIASLSLDLDNQWSYMKTHTDAGWETFPSYLDILIPRVLEFLDQRHLKITFFVVGQDAALQKNYSAIRSLASAGHEIGNHSFNHEPWLHLYTPEQIGAEIAKAEDQIERVTGHKPIGFRGPGFSLSEAVLQALGSRGYEYDATTCPMYIGPLARAYYFMTTNLSPEDKAKRRLLYGAFRDGLRPIQQYRWALKGLPQGLVEIPVTTMPFLKVPFHVSYLLYIHRFSPALAKAYFRIALFLCKLTHLSPSLLLHPLDFLGGDDVSALSFFPAMDLPGSEKTRAVSEFLRIYAEHFTVVPIREHARAISAQANFKSSRTDIQERGKRCLALRSNAQGAIDLPK